MMQNITRKPLARGVTLVEVMMVLGVVAILLGLALTMFGIVSSNMKAAATAEAINEITDAVTSFVHNQKSWDTFTSETLFQSGLVDSKYVNVSKNTLIFPNGYTGTVVGNGGTSFAIYLFGVKSSDCVALLKDTVNTSYFSFIQIAWFQIGVGHPWYTAPSASSTQYACTTQQTTTMIYVVDPGITG